MKVLVACEFTGIVRDAFLRRGHDAYSCDLKPCLFGGPHIQGDAREALKLGWDLLIAHPPCTYLTNAGVRHLHSVASRRGNVTSIHGQNRWNRMMEGAYFFLEFLNANIEKICVENPIPHKYAKFKIGEYTQLIQPWQFGHEETKATCLWLKNLPKLQPTLLVAKRVPMVHNESPSPERADLRSVTYSGIAKAMAEQWG